MSRTTSGIKLWFLMLWQLLLSFNIFWEGEYCWILSIFNFHSFIHQIFISTFCLWVLFWYTVSHYHIFYTTLKSAQLTWKVRWALVTIIIVSFHWALTMCYEIYYIRPFNPPQITQTLVQMIQLPFKDMIQGSLPPSLWPYLRSIL